MRKFDLRRKFYFHEKFKLYFLWLQENNLYGNKIATINEIDFSKRLEEILKQDTFKLLINISANILNNHIMKNFFNLIQRLSLNKTIEIIDKRKNFVNLEKLLILRNILLNKEKNLNLIWRSYFYLWKRFVKLNHHNNFKRKLLIRNVVNKKISNQDYIKRLIRRAFYLLINIDKSYTKNIDHSNESNINNEVYELYNREQNHSHNLKISFKAIEEKNINHHIFKDISSIKTNV